MNFWTRYELLEQCANIKTVSKSICLLIQKMSGFGMTIELLLRRKYKITLKLDTESIINVGLDKKKDTRP